MPGKEIDKKFSVMCELCRQHQPNLNDLAESTGFPAITVKRQVIALRTKYKMDVEFVRLDRGVGMQGYYQVNDWGIIDKEAFFKHYCL